MIWKILKSSHRRFSKKKAVFKNFAKFTEKHLCQSLSFNKSAGLRPATIENAALAQVFSCEFSKFLRTLLFIEHLQWLLLDSFFLRINFSWKFHTFSFTALFFMSSIVHIYRQRNTTICKAILHLYLTYVNVLALSMKFQKQPPEVFLRKGVLKLCRKSTWEQSNFIKITWNWYYQAEICH